MIRISRDKFSRYRGPARWVRFVGGLFALVLIAGCGDDGTEENNVRTRRTDSGVPSLTVTEDLGADADVVLFEKQGYVVARDRFLQMDWLRRASYGDLAELLGQAYLKQDVAVHAFGLRDYVERITHTIETEMPDVHRILLAYSSGVNRHLREAEADLRTRYRKWLGHGKAELRHWSVRDSVAVGAGLQYLFSNRVQSELAVSGAAATYLGEDWGTLAAFFEGTGAMGASPPASLYPFTNAATLGLKQLWEMPRAETPAGPGSWKEALSRFPFGGTTLRGATTWAVSHAHLGGDSGFLAGDLVAGLEEPLAPYEMALDSEAGGGTVRVAGFSLPGLPGVISGHGSSLAWAFSPLALDVDDFYLEFLNESESGVEFGKDEQGRPRIVPFRNRLYPVSYRTESGELVRHTVEIRYVPHHGPVISDHLPEVAQRLNSVAEMFSQKVALSYRWLGAEKGNPVALWIGLTRADTAAEAAQVVGKYGISPAAVVMLEPGQEPAMAMATHCPKRPWVSQGAPGFVPVPGLGDHEWKGKGIGAKLSGKIYRSHALVTDGSLPDFLPEADRAVLAQCGWWLGSGTRAARAKELLSGLRGLAGGVDWEHMQSLQRDSKDLLAAEFVRLLRTHRKRLELDPEQEQLADKVLSWNGYAEIDSELTSTTYRWVEAFVGAFYRVWDPRHGEVLGRALALSPLSVRTVLLRLGEPKWKDRIPLILELSLGKDIPAEQLSPPEDEEEAPEPPSVLEEGANEPPAGEPPPEASGDLPQTEAPSPATGEPAPTNPEGEPSGPSEPNPSSESENGEAEPPAPAEGDPPAPSGEEGEELEEEPRSATLRVAPAQEGLWVRSRAAGGRWTIDTHWDGAASWYRMILEVPGGGSPRGRVVGPPATLDSARIRGDSEATWGAGDYRELVTFD